jgi:uncharacterized membrane protein
MGVVAAAEAVEFLALSRDQIRIFRYILRIVGVGLIFVSTFGAYIERWGTQALQRMDEWLGRKALRPALLLLLLILAYAFLWSSVTFLRHYYFHTGYDLAIHDQVVWNTSKGFPFARSIEVTSDLGDHLRLYLPLLSLVYLVVPSPYVLLAFQSLVLALSALPVYYLSQRKFNSPAAALTIAFCVLAYTPLGFVNRFDFHGEVIAVPLLVAAYERIDAGDLKRAGLLMALALLGKENIGLSVAALGGMVALYHREWKFGLAWTVVGLV